MDLDADADMDVVFKDPAQVRILMVKKTESGALPGKRLDLGLLKISLGEVIYQFLAPAGAP